jgi:apolipoprotein N-acyltransferase
MEHAQNFQSDRSPVLSAVPVDRLSWLWLAVGAALLPLASFQTIVPLAAWLAPLFLLRFSRTQRAVVALPVLALVHYVASTLVLRSFFEGSLGYLLGLGGVTGVAAYAADSLVAVRYRGLLRTLVFPLTVTVSDWLLGLSPLGSGGAIAYSQYGSLALLQLVSLTGIWGVSFLVAWFAPVANDLWEAGRDWRRVAPRLGLYAAVVLAVIAFGSVRLALAPYSAPTVSTVRVAALAADKALWHSLTQRVADVARGTPATRAAARAEYAPLWEDLLARSRQQARAGAKIVAWSEASVFALKEDETAMLARARSLAQEEGIYLQVALVSVLATDHHPYGENRALLIDPSGAVIWDYFKTVHPFGDNAVFAPGEGVIPMVQTPYGRLATVICFDADFPALLRQAGQARADILLVPSNDWLPVKVMHSRVHVLRAIEYGLALVRPTGNGIALATDSRGQIVAEADYYTTDSLTLVADVPTQGVPTLYTRIGDAFVYACALALLGLTAAAFLSRQTRPAPLAHVPA